MSKAIGRARARARGYYPVSDGGPCRIVEEGEDFDIFAGLDKGSWFEVISRVDEPAARKPKKEEPLA